MRALSVALAVVLVASAASAAILGTEQPLAPPHAMAAPFEQIEPDLASNGTNVLAVWRDARGSVPGLARTYSAYATLLDKDAQPLAPMGVELARGVSAAQVASSGSEFLVVYAAEGRVYALRTTDGTAASVPQFLDNGVVVDVASNGSSYCAIVADPNGTRSRALILGTDGWPLRSIALEERVDAVIALDGEYLAVGTKGECNSASACSRDVIAISIAESGSVGRSTLASRRSFWLRTAAAAGDSGALVAWVGESEESGRVTEAVLVDRNGHKSSATAEVHRSETLASVGSELSPSVGFDGRRYLVGFPIASAEAELESYYVTMRLDDTGAVLDDYPIALSSAMSAGFVTAPLGGDVLLVWSERGDLYGRSVVSFSSIDEAPDPDVVIARASDVQSDVRLAVTGDVALAVWVEGDGANRIASMTFNPTNGAMRMPGTLAGYGNVTYAAPAAAAGGDMFVVVWREGFDQESRVYAQRLDTTGGKIGDPLLLDAAERSADTGTAVASDGTDFFAVWRHEQELWGARISRGGGASQPFRIASSTPGVTSVAWSGSMYLVTWRQESSVQLARVTGEGALLDPTPRVIASRGESVAVAARGDRAVALWADGGCVRGALLSSDGQIVSTLEPLACGVAASHVAVTDASDGFVAAWDGGGGARLSSAGAILERFRLTDVDAWTPALAAWEDRTLTAYSRIAADDGLGNVGRVFARSVKGGGRSRAARH